MKKKWKLPRLGRRGKTVRNLALALLLAVPVWGQYGFPLPTAELEFRRQERRLLLPESEIVYTFEDWGRDTADGSVFLFNTWVVGAEEDFVRALYINSSRRIMYHIARGEGADPVPLPIGNLAVTEILEDEGGYVSQNLGIHAALLMLDVPAGTAEARLQMDFWYRNQRCAIDANGVKVYDGVWIFPLATPEGGYSGDWYQGEAYTLACRDGGGALLLGQEGIIPDAAQ